MSDHEPTPPTPAPRWIDLEGAANARAVVPGVLLRADNLQALTSSDIRRLVDELGLEVVIDLRTDVEVESEGPGPLTREAGIRIEHRSLYPDSGGATDLETELIRPWAAASDEALPDDTAVVRAYMSYLECRPDSIVAAVRAIACTPGATLVHCAAGKDRTGVVVALALDAAGVGRATILADYMATAQRIEAIMARLLASSTYRAELLGREAREHVPVPGTMERVLDLVGARGGSARWLTEHGLAPEVLERLSHRLAVG